MIQGINDVSDILAQVAVDIPLTLQEFRCLVDQVGGQHSVDNTRLIGLVKLVQAIGKQTEGGKDKNFICFASL